MRSLIAFELKKMLGRRVAQVACVGILVMLAGIMALNVVQAKTANNAGAILSGTEAIAQMRADAEAHAGELTPERVEDDVRSYMETAFSRLSPEDVVDLSDAAAYQLVVETYDGDEFAMILDSYYGYLLAPWDAPGRETYQVAADLVQQAGSIDAAAQLASATFYEKVAQMTQTQLDEGMGGLWEYTDAERAFWMEKQEQVAEPLSYGYAGGWEDILNCVAFLAFAMVAVCVTLAPLFCGEYREGADAVLLATRHGRMRLAAAKIVAAFLFATAYFAVAAGIIAGVALVFYGADGASLPVQTMSLAIPCDLTMMQAVLTAIGLAYLMTLGFAALTLALSALFRSMLAVFALDVALLFLSGMIPAGGNAVLMHLLYLFPLNALMPQPLFSDLMSYAAGPVVLDLVGMLVLVYAIVAIAAMPASALTWKRHQVA